MIIKANVAIVTAMHVIMFSFMRPRWLESERHRQCLCLVVVVVAVVEEEKIVSLGRGFYFR